MTDRTILSLTGSDRVTFLENLVSNRVPAPGDGLRYAALLTPQGKLIGDFLLLAEPDRILLDADARIAPTLFKRLSMYKLRADVQIEEADVKVQRGTGPAPEGALPDPRHDALGWRPIRRRGGRRRQRLGRHPGRTPDSRLGDRARTGTATSSKWGSNV